MSHHGDESHEAGHAHPPPGIPEVQDEAGDTPPWVPKLGVALAVVLIAAIAASRVLGGQGAPAADEANEEVAEGEAEAAKE